MKTVLITGATSGIGRETARLFASNNFKVILCGRRDDRLRVLHEELSKISSVFTLCFDIRNQVQVANTIASLPSEFADIDILINNAGNAHGLEPIQSGEIEDWDAMIDINIKGLLYVSRAVIPMMTEKRAGHIINIGSTAAKEVYPNGNVYCATKHAVDALNQGMRMDLNQFGIRVGAIHPGLVQTEFSQVRFKGDIDRAENVYKGYEPLQPQDIAEIILFVVTRKSHINIADLVVMPTAQASSTIVNRQS